MSFRKSSAGNFYLELGFQAHGAGKAECHDNASNPMALKPNSCSSCPQTVCPSTLSPFPFPYSNGEAIGIILLLNLSHRNSFFFSFFPYILILLCSLPQLMAAPSHLRWEPHRHSVDLLSVTWHTNSVTKPRSPAFWPCCCLRMGTPGPSLPAAASPSQAHVPRDIAAAS